MKRTFFKFVIAFILFTLTVTEANAYAVKYKEDWYELYHVHYQQYPDDCNENIYWLEKAISADFCNPQFCDFKVESEKQWEKYRYLFQMHLNLKIIEQYLRLGRNYDKKCIYFYDAPWKEEYQRNLELALSSYKAGLYYWQEAKLWAEKANASSFNFLFVLAKQNWEDERERIYTGELNYERMLNREISRLEKNIEELKNLENPY